ncbi:hypothetical protein BCR33DRAFT_727257 [Rhizoclosmatium globosum]|uniref:SUR7-domain-containing protein n=1 Tax=Rhizoclosmatium globosum TaxID=329046 RepID=A0A1Y2ARK9_9FUNG|nr:hypothetical protein BCR33DRAFT_727257 [Rhizoclosmatium globosum]|eukprot:ORY24847.1 hypothetical protein BCR33DRAFT_727257 [Rhizoclosmatium globosum]
MFARFQRRAPSPSPPRYRDSYALESQEAAPPKQKRSLLSLTLMSLGAVSVAFMLACFTALSPFSASPAVASLGLININSNAAKPGDGVQSAVLTVWGYCTTSSTDSVTSCFPATDLKVIGNNSYNFQFNPPPIKTNASKQYTVTDTLDALPYKTMPILIFALPTVSIFLGVAVLSNLATLVCFLFKERSNAWIVCAKFTSSVCLISWVVLMVCVVGAGIAMSGLVAFMANFQGITASQSPTGLLLMGIAVVADSAAMGLSTWSCIKAKQFGVERIEKNAVEMYSYDQREDSYIERGSRTNGSIGRGSYASKGGATGSLGRRGSWEDVAPPSRDRDQRRRGDDRGGRGRDREQRDRKRRTYNKMDDDDDDQERSTAPGSAPAKSDWGILRTAGAVAGGAASVAGGLYGYLAGSSKPAETAKAEEPEKGTRKGGNAIANASAKRSGGGGGGGGRDRSPSRTRRSSMNRDRGGRRGGSPSRGYDDRRGGRR